MTRHRLWSVWVPQPGLHRGVCNSGGAEVLDSHLLRGQVGVDRRDGEPAHHRRVCDGSNPVPVQGEQGALG